MSERRPASPPSVRHVARVIVARGPEEEREELAEALTAEGYDVTQVGDGFALVEHLTLSCDWFPSGPAGFDLIIADDWLPSCSGLELLEEIRELDVTTPVALLATPSCTDRTTWEAVRLGVRSFEDAGQMLALVREDPLWWEAGP